MANKPPIKNVPLIKNTEKIPNQDPTKPKNAGAINWESRLDARRKPRTSPVLDFGDALKVVVMESGWPHPRPRPISALKAPKINIFSVKGMNKKDMPAIKTEIIKTRSLPSFSVNAFKKNRTRIIAKPWIAIIQPIEEVGISYSFANIGK